MAATENEHVPSITVVGSGKVSAKPNMADVQIGVVTEAASAAEALNMNNRNMEAIFQRLKDRGVSEKDMQTSNLQIMPQYNNEPEPESRREIVGYQVSNQLRVTVRQFDSLGALLDEIVGAGGNQIQGINFSIDDPTELLDEARQKAMADAKRKAKLYAEAADVTLGRVVLIQEQTPGSPSPQTFALARGVESAGSVPIAEGQQELNANVTVTYSIQ